MDKLRKNTQPLCPTSSTFHGGYIGRQWYGQVDVLNNAISHDGHTRTVPSLHSACAIGVADHLHPMGFQKCTRIVSWYSPFPVPGTEHVLKFSIIVEKYGAPEHRTQNINYGVPPHLYLFIWLVRKPAPPRSTQANLSLVGKIPDSDRYLKSSQKAVR